MALPSLSSTVVARAAAALYGLQLGYGTMSEVLTEANMSGGGVDSVIKAVYNRDFGNWSDAAVAAAVVQNLGITTGASDAVDYLVAMMAGAGAGNKGVAISDAVGLFSGMTADPVYGAAANAFNGRIAAAVTYGKTPGTADRDFGSGQTLELGLGRDFLTGTAGDDKIVARIVDTANTLQSADWIDGGAGYDRLEADMQASPFAVAPETVNVEAFAVRAQTRNTTDNGDNNVAGRAGVKIDAQRMDGVNWYESYNSRADLIVEDVRIQASQITKDITIAFVESDPGNVDMGVYFDQYSLRNQVSSSSSINLRVMDTVAAAKGEAPLKDSNYGGFKFTVTINGVSRTVDLKSAAIQDAQTYVELAAAFQAALDAELGAGAATATVGAAFTVVDPDSRQAVTGNEIVLTTKSAATFTTPDGSGWLAEGTAPPQSNFYTNYTTGTTSTSSLVTSTIVLDDVGRGSTGGDLVVGGLSTGATSSSQGVQRFEIEVRDNSKLQTISSTNNTLREVTLQNGQTTSNSNAYVTTVKDAGKLSVMGTTLANGANLFTAGVDLGALNAAAVTDLLPGMTAAQNLYGFNDVRLIDGSAMRGELTYSASFGGAAVAKYLNLRDIQALPAGDNVHVEYSGGQANDQIFVRLDAGVTASRNTIVTGREDFTFTVNGNGGDDQLNVAIERGSEPYALVGGMQAWYTNQKLNANITVNGGDGNDTIRTPGAGDFKINGGAGNDTIYADNSGVQELNAGNGQASAAGAAYQAAEAAELASALAARTLKNNTDAVKTAAVVTNLNLLDLTTPVEWNDPAAPTAGLDAQPARAAIQAAIVTALGNGALTNAQAMALAAAYNTTTGNVLSALPATLAAPAQTVTWGAAVAGNLTLADFNAGNALLETYVAAAKLAAATAAAAEANWTQQATLLNATQATVVNATLAVNGGSTGAPGEGDVIGSANVLAALQALKAGLGVGTTPEAAVAAFTAAWQAGAWGDPDAVALNNATAAGYWAALAWGPNITQAGVDALALLLDVDINTANNANIAFNAALTNAITANNTAVRNAANIVGADPDDVANASNVHVNDAVGKTETANAATAARNALSNFNRDHIDTLNGIQSTLATLKGALAIGTSELNAQILIDNAQAQINAFIATALAGGYVIPAVSLAPVTAAAIVGGIQVGDNITNDEKQDVDWEITALQFTNGNRIAEQALEQANLQAVVAATALAAEQAEAAAAASPNGGGVGMASSRAVWVFNTANQKDVTTTPGTGYVLNVNDERNVNDLKSDANNSYNFFNAKLTVTFKGLTATADVPNTGYKTSDLQVNQAIKNAINNDPVLSKLIVATDGPANTLVVTSLIDGVMSNANLGVAITLPAAGTLNTTEITGAAQVYGVTATDAAVLTAMTAAKSSFDTKGDYVDQIAETGAFGGNVLVTGAASLTTSDNTISGDSGNDVIVLGTTEGLTALTSSNDTVVFQAGFGNDTVVHFKAGALATGGDMLHFGALGGTTLSTAFNVNKSINVGDLVTTINGTAELVAGLYTDSATAQTHVYVAVDTATNIGKVYQVVDAAGTGAGSVTATLAGTIDLADTLWATLTADNFVG